MNSFEIFSEMKEKKFYQNPQELNLNTGGELEGIEGKGILSNSSSEFSPGVHVKSKVGIFSKTPSIEHSKTTYQHTQTK